MVNFGSSGIHLLIQQRCLLSTLLTENGNLKELNALIQNTKKCLPRYQSELERVLKAFRNRQIYAFESLQQLCLLLDSSKILQSGTTEKNWIRASIAKLKLFGS